MSSYFPRRPPPPPVREDETVYYSDHGDETMHTSILVFPSRAPSEPPLSPLQRPPDGLSARHGSTASIPTSLINSVEGRSSTPTDDSWDESSDDPSSSQHRPSLLTRDRVARIESVQGPPWRADLPRDSDVELWDWSASSAASPADAGSPAVSLLQGRRPLPPPSGPPSTYYESASSEIHFSASEREFSATEDDPDFESLFLVTLRPRRETQHQGRNFHRRAAAESLADAAATSSFFSPKIIPLPFESILRFFFDLDPATLNLIKQQNARPHPDNPFTSPPTNLFASQVSPESEKSYSSDMSDSALTRKTKEGRSLFVDEVHASSGMIRNGLEAEREAEEDGYGGPGLIMSVARLPVLLAKTVFRL